MKKDVINIGIAGFGTVGTGLTKLILANEDWIFRRVGKKLNIKKILVKDINKKREFLPPSNISFTDNIEDLIGDPEIDIVCELIGGTTVAKEIIKKAILAKKHVVTANKAILAENGMELFELARLQKVSLNFEASVAGGIPIIRTLKENIACNKIKSITGILNGTANFILTKMSQEGLEFKDALKIAQQKGYAEADPTLDIEGWDAAHKLVILILLAYGQRFPLNKLTVEGITSVDPYDIKMAHELGYEIKLIAKVKEKKGHLEAGVFPVLLPKKHILAKVDGPYNAILIEGNGVGQLMLYGLGAGDLSTGSSVLSDILAIANGNFSNNTGFFDDVIEDASILDDEYTSCSHYFRFQVEDRPGVLAIIAGIMGERSISIAQVVQRQEKIKNYVPVVFLTHKAQIKNIKDAVEEINKLSFVYQGTKHYRILS